MEATRRGVLMAVTRGWLGYGRRWKGGHQAPPDPIPVIVVGAEESDDSPLNAIGQTSISPVGLHARAAIQAREIDVFVEQITSSATQLRLRVEPIVGSPASADLLRGEAGTAPGGTTLMHGGSFPDETTWALLAGSARFDRPGLIVPAGFQLTVQEAAAAVDLSVTFVFREQR